MTYKLLLTICIMMVWTTGLEDINLPCSSNNIPDVFWPDIDNGTCSTSVPGCITPEGALQIRCCVHSQPTVVNCIKNYSIQDPRCLGNMKSTIGNLNMNICYEFVNHTTFPFKCASRTGRMLKPDFKMLTALGGFDTGIWLPILKYEDTFRYSTINNFYMDRVVNQTSTNPFDRCMILIRGDMQEVSCDEHYLGICLDFSFTIYQFSVSNLDDLLCRVKDFCTTNGSDEDFCWYFRKRYDMNLVYFSSRANVDQPFMILQKSNSRFILQIRKNDIPRSDGVVNLHVALMNSDWDIFLNTSFPFSNYLSTDEDVYEIPKVILSADPDPTNITVYKNNSNNIKWTQKEEYTQYIFCFSSAAPDYKLEKYEVLDNFQTVTEGQNAVIWCEAFDFDLNVISSNVISVGVQTFFYYISEMTVTIGEIQSCNSHYIRIRIIDSFTLCKKDRKFVFDIRNLIVTVCELDETVQMATVNVTTYWYVKYPALRTDLIEFEYSRLKRAVEDISKECIKTHLNISSLHYVRHSDYCLEETTIIGDFPFFWRTTPNNSKTVSLPYCFTTQNKSSVLERSCFKSPTGAVWSNIKHYCEPTSNLTELLEIYSSEKFGQTGILHNMNVIIQKYYEKFLESDVYSLSKVITRLKGIPSNIDKGLGNLSLLVNNLHYIRTDVLKISQDKFQTTDSIMNSSDSMYANTGGSQNLTEAHHCYYTINFTEHPNATGVILQNFGKLRQLKLLESSIPSSKLRGSDTFEGAIFFDEESLKRSKKDANITTVKFSIFFNNYLFDVNHPDATNRTIFKILSPNKNELEPFTSFLTMKNQRKREICSCWKYANTHKNIPESRWYRNTKFDIDSMSLCVIKSVSYCTIFTSEHPDTKGFISRFSIEYSDMKEHNSDETHFVYHAIGDILDQIQLRLLDEVTYEFKHKTKMDATPRKHEVVVVWIPHGPKGNIGQVEKEYSDLKHAIEASAQNCSNNTFINNMVVEYLRHRKYCLYDLYNYKNFTIIFETTPTNKSTISLPPCYTSKGIFHRKCIGNYDVGAYWEKLNNIHFLNCSSNVTEILDYIFKHFQNEDANDVLNGLKEMTAKSAQDFNPRDIFLLSEILFLISNSTQNIDSRNVSVLTSNIQEMDKNILRDAQRQFNATDQILYSLDRILLTSDVILNKEKNFYTVELKNFKESIGLIIQRHEKDYNVSIINGRINQLNILEKFRNFESAVFFNGFETKQFIKVSLFFQDVLFVDSTWKHRVSLIFGVLLPDQKETSKSHGEIELIFKNHEDMDKACAFWKYGLEEGVKIRGKWKNESQPNARSNFSTCIFNHTTHFAMLIDDSDTDPEYLRIVTNIGCILSMIGLIGILITGLIFERWRKNLGNIILMNFVFTVIIQICLFYFSGLIHRAISNSVSCILVGAILHYSVISEFCWMLIIAILQFKRFVQVLTSPPKNVILKSFSVGWGFPLIPVLSLLLTDPSSYTDSRTGLCYPSKLGLYLSVWLPILVITLINFIIFFYIMYSICNRKTECVDTVSNEIIFQWRLAVLLFFMLGLTWSFAFIGEFMLKDMFLYLFCITSTLQGFIMFLFFIVFNERTRLLYAALFRKHW